MLAWVLVGLVPGPWSDYPYYAPLGAVIATSLSVRGSTRQSLQAGLAIAVGAGVALLTDLLPVPSVAGLAVVVLVGVLLSEWRPLGTMGSWVPSSALFVLIIGNRDPVGYVSAYIGLTFVGALVGVAVNLLLPPLPLTPADRALARLRAATTAHLSGLAEALRDPDQDPPDLAPLRAARAAAAGAVAEAQEAAHANWSARRYQDWLQRQAGYATGLSTAARVARDASRVVDAVRAQGPDGGGAGSDSGRAAADALDAAAALVRELRADGTADAEQERLAAVLDTAQEVIATHRTGGATRPADGLIVTLAPLLQTRSAEAED